MLLVLFLLHTTQSTNITLCINYSDCRKFNEMDNSTVIIENAISFLNAHKLLVITPSEIISRIQTDYFIQSIENFVTSRTILNEVYKYKNNTIDELKTHICDLFSELRTANDSTIIEFINHGILSDINMLTHELGCPTHIIIHPRISVPSHDYYELFLSYEHYNHYWITFVNAVKNITSDDLRTFIIYSFYVTILQCADGSDMNAHFTLRDLKTWINNLTLYGDANIAVKKFIVPCCLYEIDDDASDSVVHNDTLTAQNKCSTPIELSKRTGDHHINKKDAIVHIIDQCLRYLDHLKWGDLQYDNTNVGLKLKRAFSLLPIKVQRVLLSHFKLRLHGLKMLTSKVSYEHELNTIFKCIIQNNGRCIIRANSIKHSLMGLQSIHGGVFILPKLFESDLYDVLKVFLVNLTAKKHIHNIHKIHEKYYKHSTLTLTDMIYRKLKYDFHFLAYSICQDPQFIASMISIIAEL